jgi:hypothetical protein
MQLVAQLRTRLSYAITKVNKGWEDYSIDEVESRSSQAGSPSSSTTTLQGSRNLGMSPRDAIASLQGHSREISHIGNVAILSPPLNDPLLYGDGQSSRTYESFWREQSQKSISSNSFNHTSKHPSLAPSADFTSAARRASHPRRTEASSFTKPPTILGKNTSDLSQSSQVSMGSHSPTPRTPNRVSQAAEAILQSTNQKSLQERDAIETLLFMSSPGNSGNLKHTFSPPGLGSQQPSPLRTEFGAPLRGAHGRNVEFAGVRSLVAGEAGSATPRGKGLHQGHTGLSKSGEDMYDRILDAPDTDSSDDEIEIPITPRRLAASRS